MLILGIESSCDDTAAAIVADDRAILSSVVSSQIDAHARFGGVVPEIAARAHLESIDHIIKSAIVKANINIQDIDGIAATAGPGLIGGVMVGLVAGKTLATYLQKPLFGINHLEGHALSPRLADQSLDFPYLLLLISGCHTQIIWVENVGKYSLIGTSLDDAAGECLDKSAKIMGLPFPGGKHIDALAVSINESGAKLPIPLHKKNNCDFSFSGLKTAVQNLVAQQKYTQPEIAFSLMHSVSGHLIQRLENAMAILPQKPTALVTAGGVAASQFIKEKLIYFAQKHHLKHVSPPPALCTDNAAMIAWAAIERINLNFVPDLTNIAPQPRWPLYTITQGKPI